MPVKNRLATPNADAAAARSTLDASRVEYALGAAWEVEALAMVLLDMQDSRPEGTDFAVRGIAIRMRELASIAMSALGDDAVTKEELHFMLAGTPSKLAKET